MMISAKKSEMSVLKEVTQLPWQEVCSPSSVAGDQNGLDLICRYGVPRFVLTDNGGEWDAEFETMCRDYAIHHQRTAPQWPQCNGMAERMIKTLKHGITVLAADPANTNC
jgi:hypothetical protein